MLSRSTRQIPCIADEATHLPHGILKPPTIALSSSSRWLCLWASLTTPHSTFQPSSLSSISSSSTPLFFAAHAADLGVEAAIPNLERSAKTGLGPGVRRAAKQALAKLRGPKAD